MSLIMDNRLDLGNKEEEVKKLQELVKKLELQNKELRSERQALKSGNETVHEKIDACLKMENEKVKLEAIPPVSVEENQLSDEETWLYESPEGKGHSVSWLRKDLDDPCLAAVKKSLANKLDLITNSPRHSPRHSLYSPASSSSGVFSPESPPSNREIDSRTFIRPKKRRSLILDNSFEEIKSTCLQNKGSQERIGAPRGGTATEDEDHLSSASEGGSCSTYRLADVEDINTLARLQEESLKLPEHKPASRLTGIRVQYSSRIPSKPQGGSSGGSATSSQEDLLGGSNPPVVDCSPRKGALSRLQAPTLRKALAPPSRENSEVSSPPDSPYNSQQSLDNCNGRGSTSRLASISSQLRGSDPRLLDPPITSSPNHSRGTSPLPQDNGVGGRVSRLPQIRGGSRLSAPSPVRIPMGPPQLTQIARSSTNGGAAELPKAKNGGTALPRPGTLLQQPRQRVSKNPSDWREGCY